MLDFEKCPGFLGIDLGLEDRKKMVVKFPQKHSCLTIIELWETRQPNLGNGSPHLSFGKFFAPKWGGTPPDSINPKTHGISKNWWFGDPRPLRYTNIQTPLYQLSQGPSDFLGNGAEPGRVGCDPAPHLWRGVRLGVVPSPEIPGGDVVGTTNPPKKRVGSRDVLNGKKMEKLRVGGENEISIKPKLDRNWINSDKHMKVFARCYKNLPNQRSLEDAFPRTSFWIVLPCISPIYRNSFLKKLSMIQKSCQRPAILWNPIGKKCGKYGRCFLHRSTSWKNAEPRSTGTPETWGDRCDGCRISGMSTTVTAIVIVWMDFYGKNRVFFASWSIYPQSFVPIII